MKNIAIYGGTFNPIHNGHIVSLQQLLDDKRFDEVLLMPSGVPPFKNNVSHTIKDRLHMCKLVQDELKELSIEEYEANSIEPSYTYETLKHLSKLNPDNKYYWTIGYDNLFQIETWYKGEDILSEFGIIAVNRGGYDPNAATEKLAELIAKYNTDLLTVTIPNIEISSSDIRERVSQSKSIVGYTTERVIGFIKDKHLYKEV